MILFPFSFIEGRDLNFLFNSDFSFFLILIFLIINTPSNGEIIRRLHWKLVLIVNSYPPRDCTAKQYAEKENNGKRKKENFDFFKHWHLFLRAPLFRNQELPA
jgi:hypothetical protein